MAAVKGDVQEIKADLKESKREHKAGQREIIKRIDGLSAVTVERWEARNEYVDGQLSDHEIRIQAMEKRHTIEDNAISSKLRLFIEREIVKIIGISIIGVLLVSVFYYVNQSSNYSGVINRGQ